LIGQHVGSSLISLSGPKIGFSPGGDDTFAPINVKFGTGERTVQILTLSVQKCKTTAQNRLLYYRDKFAGDTHAAVRKVLCYFCFCEDLSL